MRTAMPYPEEMRDWLGAAIASSRAARERFHAGDAEALAEAVQTHVRARIIADRLAEAESPVDPAHVDELATSVVELTPSLEALGHDVEEALAGNGIGAIVSLAVDLEYGVPAVIHPGEDGRTVMTWMDGPSGELGKACPVPDDFGGFWEVFRPKLLGIAEKYRNAQIPA